MVPVLQQEYVAINMLSFIIFYFPLPRFIIRLSLLNYPSIGSSGNHFRVPTSMMSHSPRVPSPLPPHTHTIHRTSILSKDPSHRFREPSGALRPPEQVLTLHYGFYPKTKYEQKLKIKSMYGNSLYTT